MTDPHIRQVLLEYISSDEPPLGLTADGTIRAGRRSRGVRRLSYGAGGAAALVGIVVATTALSGLPSNSGPAPVGNASYPMTCRLENVPRATITTPPGGPPPATIDPEQFLGDQLTCVLREAVPAALPGATFANLRGAPYLVAVPDESGFSATAVVITPAGKGLLIFVVSDEAAPTDAERAEHCAKATCRTGPHGEYVEVYDFGADPRGVHGRTVYLYSGHSRILAGAHNVSEETDEAAPTMADPPLTVDQLIGLAGDPRLVLFP